MKLNSIITNLIYNFVDICHHQRVVIGLVVNIIYRPTDSLVRVEKHDYHLNIIIN